MPDRTRFAWLKLNAYGVILAGLALLALEDLIHPAGSNLAALVGEIPPGQTFWTVGFAVSGVLLVYSFLRSDRVVETLALAILFLSVVVQSVVAYRLLGWTDFTFARLAVIAIIGLGGGARVSALWTKHGLVITIPGRCER